MTPLEALRKGLDESLFLAFREKCLYLEKSVAAGGEIPTGYSCSHDGNRDGVFHGQLPNCYLNACPIFKRVKGKDADELIPNYRIRMAQA